LQTDACDRKEEAVSSKTKKIRKFHSNNKQAKFTVVKKGSNSEILFKV